MLMQGSLKTGGAVWIIADQQVLFQVNGGVIEGCLALMSTYYVFMYLYPSSLDNFFTYMQKCILNVADAKKMPTAIIKFVNSLSA